MPVMQIVMRTVEMRKVLPSITCHIDNYWLKLWQRPLKEAKGAQLATLTSTMRIQVMMIFRWKDWNQLLARAITRRSSNNSWLESGRSQTCQPTTSAQRWSSAQGKALAVDQPFSIHAYNNGMGGVDRMDQNISKYRIHIRSKKWWWPFFAYMIDVSVKNAWLLYSLCASNEQRPLDLLGFRREICQVCATMPLMSYILNYSTVLLSRNMTIVWYYYCIYV